MTTIVLPVDLKRWTVGYLAGRLERLGHDVDIGIKTPKTMPYPLAKPLITIGELTPTKYDLVQWDQDSPSTSAPAPGRTTGSATTSRA
mgnify:CR=1 FL=1